MNTDFNMSAFTGAVYFPSRAYNAYQTYEYFDATEIDRDFSYAEKAGITALRIFTSYEQYEKDNTVFFEKFETLLSRAAAHGIKVMPILFENCGRDFTEENAMDRDPFVAVCVKSPCLDIVKDESRWAPCHAYTQTFMSRYGADERIMAIEVMNEPAYGLDLPFAIAMLKTAKAHKASVPLTIGCITLEQCLWFGDLLDVYQFHDNFPSDLAAFEKKLEDARRIKEVTGKPVWLSEWQRLRTSGPGWDVEKIPEEEIVPCLASLAPAVKASGLGSFFWCLMVKPAYLSAQRPNGTFNGLFHEDGSVYSIADYRAIGGKEDVAERKSLPLWYIEAKERT